MERIIHLRRTSGKVDFRDPVDEWWYLCSYQANAWFELRGMNSIELKISTKPSKHAYKIRFDGDKIEVYDPRGEEWCSYYSYRSLRQLANEVASHNSSNILYLSITGV